MLVLQSIHSEIKSSTSIPTAPFNQDVMSPDSPESDQPLLSQAESKLSVISRIWVTLSLNGGAMCVPSS